MGKTFAAIVIGAGPAGMFAAELIAGSGLETLLLERNDTAGKKLLLSGQGQCNLTHAGRIEDFFCRYPEKERFVKHSLYAFDNNRLLDFFQVAGITFFTDENGKIFPASRKAEEIRKCLVNNCRISGVKVEYNAFVSRVEHMADGAYKVSSKKNHFISRNLLIATGGKSYPSTGSAGDGYNFARLLGHNIVTPRPALASFVIAKYPFLNCAGISFKNIKVKLIPKKNHTVTMSGDMLLTHTGLSGPVILHLSRYASDGDELRINFTQEQNKEKSRADFLNVCSVERSLSVRTLFKRSLPERIADRILAEAGVSTGTVISQLNKKNLIDLSTLLCDFPMRIKSAGNFDEAMVTAGGIDCREIEPRSMESKLHKGLYFIGEVLDVDGESGGYNLQFAFSSAYAAAQNILKNLHVKNSY
jgi:predicted Rossmann fold flavoprotein